MFTGLIEEIGTVAGVSDGSLARRLTIRCKTVLQNAKIGDSIATNGVCLTAVEIGGDYFTADCMHETIRKTNLIRLKAGDAVNLEKSLTLAAPLGGHLVTGDVDFEARIASVEKDGIAKIYTIETPAKYLRYMADKGRVSVDGASLTIMALTRESFSLSLIPHTQEAATLGRKKAGDYVNIETDLIAKYVERMLLMPTGEAESPPPRMNREFLAKYGF
ncbi:MAG: riboflavin synthase [Treponema sp.]